MATEIVTPDLEIYQFGEMGYVVVLTLCERNYLFAIATGARADGLIVEGENDDGEDAEIGDD